jgi:serine/threonine protein kinase
MHDLRIVHGDLKGVGIHFPPNKHPHTSHSFSKANILINKDRRACIADFSLTTVTGVGSHAAPGASPISTMSDDTLMSFTAGGTYRWMSPELLDPERFGIPQSEGERPTRQSDCYALGMVIYEASIHSQKSRFFLSPAKLKHHARFYAGTTHTTKSRIAFC